MRRDLQKKMKHLETNYQIGATQCLAIATINLPPKVAFLLHVTRIQVFSWRVIMLLC